MKKINGRMRVGKVVIKGVGGWRVGKWVIKVMGKGIIQGMRRGGWGKG